MQALRPTRFSTFPFICVATQTTDTLPLPAPCSVADLDTLRALFIAREGRALGALAARMAAAGSAADVFDTWMYHESDAVQYATQTFGEREVLEAGIKALATVSPALHAVLAPTLQLYALACVEADLGQLVCGGLVSAEAGAAVPERSRALCAELTPQWRVLVEGLGVPDHLVASPIAADWGLYNEASEDSGGGGVGPTLLLFRFRVNCVINMGMVSVTWMDLACRMYVCVVCRAGLTLIVGSECLCRHKMWGSC